MNAFILSWQIECERTHADGRRPISQLPGEAEVISLITRVGFFKNRSPKERLIERSEVKQTAR